MIYVYELYLVKKDTKEEDWRKLIQKISNYNGFLQSWNFIVTIMNHKIRYFIKTKCVLPATIDSCFSFVIKRVKKKRLPNGIPSFPMIKIDSNLISLLDYCTIRKKEELKLVEIHFREVLKNKVVSQIFLYLQKKNKLYKCRLLGENYSYLLSLDFSNNPRYLCQSTPNYLDIRKGFSLLSSDLSSSIFKVDTYPYLQGDFYIQQNNYDFNKHSLILGSSGCGKSKFISLFIHRIYQSNDLNLPYKIVVIDPHASLEKDIGGLGKVIDFNTLEDSIDLFVNHQKDAVVSTELLLELFQSLIKDQYNSKLERVLRHSIHTLLIGERFHFENLRKIILDVTYRNDILKELKEDLPASILRFFLSDFNDLKTKSYGEAISPIISFIDEMEILPVFSKKMEKNSLMDTINDHFLTLFSLDRTKLGDKIVKTISGFIMQQLLTMIQSSKMPYPIVFIIDEVATVENPILSRFLSEARKYHLSLILASQYFNQVSTSLKDSIFANVSNYYIFRVSRLDANILVDNFNMKIPLDDSREKKIKLLSELKNRECVVRVSSNGCLLPAMKAETLDFCSIPRKKVVGEDSPKKEKTKDRKKSNFQITSNVCLKDILISTSSSRKDVRK